MNIEIFVYSLDILVYFLVFDYSFNFCACAETKHVQSLGKLNGDEEIYLYEFKEFEQVLKMYP